MWFYVAVLDFFVISIKKRLFQIEQYFKIYDESCKKLKSLELVFSNVLLEQTKLTILNSFGKAGFNINLLLFKKPLHVYFYSQN